MKKVELIRLEQSEQGTLGALRIDGVLECVTLEPDDLDNKTNVSCIPIGEYKAVCTISPRFGVTFEVTNVPDRSHILFHAGNIIDHTKGCILLGRKWGMLNGDRAVLNSGNTFKAFMGKMKDQTAFKLTVKECL